MDPGSITLSEGGCHILNDLIPCIWNTQNRQIHRNRKYINGFQELMREDLGGETANAHAVLNTFGNQTMMIVAQHIKHTKNQ